MVKEGVRKGVSIDKWGIRLSIVCNYKPKPPGHQGGYFEKEDPTKEAWSEPILFSFKTTGNQGSGFYIDWPQKKSGIDFSSKMKEEFILDKEILRGKKPLLEARRLLVYNKEAFVSLLVLPEEVEQVKEGGFMLLS